MFGDRRALPGMCKIYGQQQMDQSWGPTVWHRNISISDTRPGLADSSAQGSGSLPALLADIRHIYTRLSDCALGLFVGPKISSSWA